ncbi:hypothetical protein BHE74_00043209 [Ensete ventricosum]|nr:hypothetical protein BHE74_00043209 [Ensete ventricosum]
MPFAAGNRHANGQPPLRPAPLPRLAVGLAVGGNPLRASRYRLALASWPLAVAPTGWPQAMVGRPCRGPVRGQPPLHADSMHVAAPPPQAMPPFAANRCNKRV